MQYKTEHKRWTFMNALYDFKNSIGAEWNALNLTLWGGLSSKYVLHLCAVFTGCRQKAEILQVQELFLLYIGGNTMSTASLPDQIKYIKEKSGFMFVFHTKSYSTATKVCFCDSYSVPFTKHSFRFVYRSACTVY